MHDRAEELQRAVNAVPSGTVTTYGAIGRAIGTSPRAVGRLLAMHGSDVPWWRVVLASGHPPPQKQERALEHFLAESTPLTCAEPEAVRVDLTRARWSGLR